MEPLAKLIDVAFNFIASGVLISVGVLIWKASARFTRLETSVTTLIDNHLPHIIASIEDNSKEIKSLREGLGNGRS